MSKLILMLIIKGQLVTVNVDYHNSQSCENGKTEMINAYTTYGLAKEPVTIFSAICTDLDSGVAY